MNFTQPFKEMRMLVRGLTSPFRLRPSLLVIGAQKAGTSSFQKLLASHPAASGTIRGETNFFDVNYRRGMRWYMANFCIGTTGKFSFDKSPYYLFHPLVPQRVAEAFREVKLLAMLRDPILRAFSHYQHSKRYGFETLSFEDAFEAEEERLAGEAEKMQADPIYQSLSHRHHSYKARGRYAEQLERWLKYFPRERFMIVQSEKFFTQPEDVYRHFLAFAGLPGHPGATFRATNVGGYGDKISPSTQDRLKAYFEPYNRALYRLIGETYDWGQLLNHPPTISSTPLQEEVRTRPERGCMN